MLRTRVRIFLYASMGELGYRVLVNQLQSVLACGGACLQVKRWLWWILCMRKSRFAHATVNTHWNQTCMNTNACFYPNMNYCKLHVIVGQLVRGKDSNITVSWSPCIGLILRLTSCAGCCGKYYVDDVGCPSQEYRPVCLIGLMYKLTELRCGTSFAYTNTHQ